MTDAAGDSAGQKKLRRISLTEFERYTLLKCMRIACEDGSVFGGYDEGNPEYREIVEAIRALERKLS